MTATKQRIAGIPRVLATDSRCPSVLSADVRLCLLAAGIGWPADKRGLRRAFPPLATEPCGGGMDEWISSADGEIGQSGDDDALLGKAALERLVFVQGTVSGANSRA